MGTRTDDAGAADEADAARCAGERAVERVWRRLGPAAREALERDLSPTDLQTLLMAVVRARAHRVTPSRVRDRWAQDRFVRPSSADPRRLVRVEARLWELLPEAFEGVELSPVAPLGTCAAVGAADQNRVVGTVRGTEVVSDPTNALAVEGAARRAGQGSDGRVDLASCLRVLRAQAFDGPGLFAHFRLFALVSTARRRGSGLVESELLCDHLRVWARALGELVPHRRPRLTVSAFGDPVMEQRLRDTVLPALAAEPGPVPVVLDTARTQGAAYYARAALGVRAERDGREVDLGDGGLTTWTASLLGDAKEVCLASAVSIERLALLGAA